MKRARTESAKAKRRQNILDAALNVFYLQGFKAARTEDIAKQAQVSKGTVFLYFPNKESIFHQLIISIALEKISFIESLMLNRPTFQEAISALFEQLPIFIQQKQFPKLIKILISDAASFPDSLLFYRTQVIEKGLEALTQLIQRGIDSGEITAKNINPALTARLVVAPVLFSIIWKTVFEQLNENDTALNVNELLSQHKTLLFNALLNN